GWRVAFAASASLVETPGVSFALRIGGEDLPLGPPASRDVAAEAAAPEAVSGDVAERLAAIATELSRRDDLEERIQALAGDVEVARSAAAEAAERAKNAEEARAASSATLAQLVEVHGQLESWAAGATERQTEAENRIGALQAEVERRDADLAEAQRRVAQAGREAEQSARQRAAADAARAMA